MARRAVRPVAGRRQAEPAQPVAPAQILLTNALLVPLDQLVPDPGQPRRHFDEAALGELAASIEEEGVLQPLLVYEDGALDDGRTRYTIVDGERRYRAARRVRSDVPVIVLAGLDIADVRIRQLVANLQREELDPLEEALALRQLMQLAHLSFEDVAKRIGKPRAYVQRRTDLLYDPRLTEAIRDGRINASVAIELRRFPDQQRQSYLDRVADGERLEVAQLREEKRRARAILFGDGSDAPRRSHDAEAVPASPAAGSLYRFDTYDTTNDQSSSAHPTGLPEATPPYRIDPSQAMRNGEGEGRHPLNNGYRLDTPSDRPSAETALGPTEIGPQPSATGKALTPGDASPFADEDATRWAMVLADALVQAGDVMPHGGLIQAIVSWRDAGRPTGWGDAFIHALDQRL